MRRVREGWRRALEFGLLGIVAGGIARPVKVRL